MTESEYHELIAELSMEDPRMTWEQFPIACIQDINDVKEGLRNETNIVQYCKDFITFFKHRIGRYHAQKELAENAMLHYLHQNPQPLTRRIREKNGYTPQIIFQTLEQLDISYKHRQYSEGFMKYQYMTDQWLIKWLEQKIEESQ